MEKKPKFTYWGPSFFKVLLDYANRLRLPPVFVRNYGEFLNGSVELKTNSGETWNVEIGEEIYDDGVKYWCFVGGGWRKFVNDLELQLGEFLVFVFNASESTFDVTVFGTHCCERQISAMAVKSEADSGLMGGNLRFTAVIREYNAFVMDIPKDFAIETGIAGKSTVKLQNMKGKEWVVELPIMKYGRIRMSEGWSNFFGENNVVIGSKCLFDFDPISGNLIVKKEGEFSKTGRERSTEYMRVPAKRGRGRPPKNLLDVEFEPNGYADSSETFTGMRGKSPTIRGRGRGRGRGRPPKNLLDVKFESDGYVDSSETFTGMRGKSPTIRGRGRGRGRPPKNLLDVEFESDGYVDSSETFTGMRGKSLTIRGRGRGRGRPPKNLLDMEFESNGDETGSEFFTGMERGSSPTIRGRGGGRGRPPKNVLDVEFESNGDEDSCEIFTGMRRRRGRTPPKNLLDVEFESDFDEDGFEIPTGKGKERGRPHKNLMVVESDSDGDEDEDDVSEF